MEVACENTNTIIDSKTDKELLLYNLIVLQINNLVNDLRIIFPSDIVLKVCHNNMSNMYQNKIEFVDYLKKQVTSELQILIQSKNESLFDKDNKTLMNLNFKRSSYVFNKMRSNWELLDSSSRNVVWKYLNFILKLLEKV